MQVQRGLMGTLSALCFFAEPIQAQIQAQLQASRLACTAPCTVQFDASASTHGSPDIEPFTDLEYLWDFGDAGAGRRSTGALRGSRNEAIGPLATSASSTTPCSSCRAGSGRRRLRTSRTRRMFAPTTMRCARSAVRTSGLC